MASKDITQIIDEFTNTDTMSSEDYDILIKYVKGKIYHYRYGRNIKAYDVVNDMLLYLKTKKKSYNISFNKYQKKRYINYIILKRIQHLIKFMDNIVDAGAGKVFPLSDKSDRPAGLQTLSNLLLENEPEYIDNTSKSNIIIDCIMSRLGLLTDTEFEVFVETFFKERTQTQLSEELHLTQQRICQIIKSIKKKIRGSISLL